MDLIFTSKYVRFGLGVGREDDRDDLDFVSNSGGNFEVASAEPETVDEDDDDGDYHPPLDGRFGFRPQPRRKR